MPKKKTSKKPTSSLKGKPLAKEYKVGTDVSMSGLKEAITEALFDADFDTFKGCIAILLEKRDYTEITNKTIGIVGLGRVGKQVAKRLTGFETNTIYYDIVDMPDEVQRDLNAHPVAFEELLRESDIVSLHVPLTLRTRSMISDRELAMMKPTAYLVNACRGPVVDEKALHRALNNGLIAGAGLDVLEVEPTPVDNPLFDLDNVLITPHMAGASQETNLRAAEFAYSNIKLVLAGRPPESLVTPEG